MWVVCNNLCFGLVTGNKILLVVYNSWNLHDNTHSIVTGIPNPTFDEEEDDTALFKRSHEFGEYVSGCKEFLRLSSIYDFFFPETGHALLQRRHIVHKNTSAGE